MYETGWRVQNALTGFLKLHSVLKITIFSLTNSIAVYSIVPMYCDTYRQYTSLNMTEAYSTDNLTDCILYLRLSTSVQKQTIRKRIEQLLKGKS